MAETLNSEIVGSNDQAVTLGPQPVQSEIKLAPGPLGAYAASYTADTVARDKPGEPDRLFIKLHHIRGNQGACIFDVTVTVPGAAAAPATVGSLALFGLEYASDKGNEHGGGGLSKTFEITEEVDPYLPELRQAGKILVGISPRGVLGPNDQVTVEKIDVYRLSAR
jgi:hypothetical protein